MYSVTLSPTAEGFFSCRLMSSHSNCRKSLSSSDLDSVICLTADAQTMQESFLPYSNVGEYRPCDPMYMKYVFKVCAQKVSSFSASFTHAAEITAFVDATAGMIFFTTPRVLKYVTPSILNYSALSNAFSYTHCISTGLSLFNFFSGNVLSHSTMNAYAMQCSGTRGFSAIVHMGNPKYE